MWMVSKVSLSPQAPEFDNIESMWAALKTAVTTASDKKKKKKKKTRRTHPWVCTNLRRMMRRKQRAHRKAKMSCQARDWDRYKKLQSEVQRSTRTAHRRYMAVVVSNGIKDNTKRFCSFIKSKRQRVHWCCSLDEQGRLLEVDLPRRLKYSTSNSSRSTPTTIQTKKLAPTHPCQSKRSEEAPQRP